MDVEEHAVWSLVRERAKPDRSGGSLDRAVDRPVGGRAAKLGSAVRGDTLLDGQRRRVGLPPRDGRDEGRRLVPELRSERLELVVPERHGRGAYASPTLLRFSSCNTGLRLQ